MTSGQTSGFEIIHGLLDRVMELLEANRCDIGSADGFYIKSECHLTSTQLFKYFCFRIQRVNRHRSFQSVPIFTCGMRR